MEFLIGCNYWASNAGTEMWRQFDQKIIEKDISVLAANGVKCIRLFPNWRDFQPVRPVYGVMGAVEEYAMETGGENPYFLDEEMLERFDTVMEICEQHGIRVIVGLLTGWMSGGLFIPTALYGKNLITDPFAIYMEQLYIKGFVSRMKKHSCIYAWDIGNECNCLSPTETRWQNAAWTGTITGAIRAADGSRPVISGMHGLHLSADWAMEDQAEFTDILTTHPYPYFTRHTKNDFILSYRTTLFPTAQTKMYAEIGGKPCLAEEMGTLGPTLNSQDSDEDYFRINLLSLWANGATGALWWCANDQTLLDTHPYTHVMMERELGMLDVYHQPKPVMKAAKAVGEMIASLDFTLPSAESDAVCLLTEYQNYWGVGYMSYCLMKKLGLNLTFAHGNKNIPDAPLYLLPSIKGDKVMIKKYYEQLLAKVKAGATLYISVDNSLLFDFEGVTGLRVEDSYEHPRRATATIDGKEIPFTTSRTYRTTPVTAKVLAHDEEGLPFMAENTYGKGKVYTVMAPIEDNLVNAHNAFDGPVPAVYQALFGAVTRSKTLQFAGDVPAVTYHTDGENRYAVLLNHTDKALRPHITNLERIGTVYYGDPHCIAPFDGCVLKLK